MDDGPQSTTMGRIIPVFLLAVATLAAIYFTQRRRKGRKDPEPYGSFHLALNTFPGREHERPKTEWLNMGLWDVSE